MTAPDDLVRQARNAAIDTMPTRKLAEDTLYWLMADEIVRLRERVAELEAENARLKEWQVAMVNKAADKSLAGYRELATKCADLEQRAEKAGASESEARAKIAEQLIEIGLAMGLHRDSNTNLADYAKTMKRVIEAAKAMDEQAGHSTYFPVELTRKLRKALAALAELEVKR